MQNNIQRSVWYSSSCSNEQQLLAGTNPFDRFLQDQLKFARADSEGVSRIGCVRNSGFRLHQPLKVHTEHEKSDQSSIFPGCAANTIESAAPSNLITTEDHKADPQSHPVANLSGTQTDSSACADDKLQTVNKNCSAWEGILDSNRDRLIALQRKLSRGAIKHQSRKAQNPPNYFEQRSCSLNPLSSQRKTSIGSTAICDSILSFQATLESIHQRNQKINENGAQKVRKLKRRYTKMLKCLSKSRADPKMMSVLGQQDSNSS